MNLSDRPGLYVSVSSEALSAKPGKNFDWNAYYATFSPERVADLELYQLATSGHGFMPVFNGKRSQETFDLAQHIGVDLDNKDEDGFVSLDDLLANPLVAAYASFIYPTLSHTPEHPRYRVVFVLDQPITTANGYLAAQRTVHSLFPGADPACIDPTRLFYGTVHPGVWLGRLLPLADLRLYARQLQRQAEQPQHRAYAPAAATRHRTLSVPSGLNLDDVMQRLQHVDPYSLTYDEWVKLGAAIGHEFGEMAFGRFKQWSDRPGKEELTLSKWRSMCKPHHNEAGGGTIVYIINKYGRAA